MKFALFPIAALLLLTGSAAAQFLPFAPMPAPLPAQPYYEWRVIDRDELSLWKNGQQIGNLQLDTLTYRPRLGPGRWGVPEDPPVDMPMQYIRQTSRKRLKPSENGIMGPGGSSNIPNTGARIRQSHPTTPKGKPKPPSRIRNYGTQSLPQAAADIPDYGAMPSLTFVAKDGAVADAALATFQSAPELAKWRDKYGARAKAYSFDDFMQTSYAFKLDEDTRFKESGFVALAQPQAPDENDQAKVYSIYEFSSPTQFAGALRDANDRYHPDDQPDTPLPSAEWSIGHIVTASVLMLTIPAVLAGVVLVRRRQGVLI